MDRPGPGLFPVVFGAANGAPLVLDEAARALAGGRRDPDTLRSAIAADLDRAVNRHFDEFERNLHMVAAMRAILQATA